MSDASLSRLRDHVRIWQVDPVGHTETLVAEAATAGAAAPEVAQQLAAEAEAASRSRRGELVARLAEELGLEPLHGVAAQDAAVAAMARRLLADAVTPRELTYWVTRVVGLRGSARTQPFLTLEQEYCDRLGQDVTDLDARVRTEAEAFLAPPVEDAQDGRGRGLLARLTRRRG